MESTVYSQYQIQLKIIRINKIQITKEQYSLNNKKKQQPQNTASH